MKTIREPPSLFRAIRYRLLLWNLLVFVMVLMGFIVAIRFIFIHNLRQQLTIQLTALAQRAASEMEWEDNQLEIDTEDFSLQEITTRQQSIQWFNPQGQIITSLGTLSPIRTLHPEQTVIYEKSPRLLAITYPIVSNDELIGYVRTSQTLAELDSTVNRLDWGFSSGILLAIFLSAIGVLWLNYQAMRPIEESFHRLQQFTADASHELRSPLMAITANAEVALKYSEGMREADRDTFAIILNAAAQLTQLTQDLLAQARADQQPIIEVAEVDLSHLLDQLVRLYRLQADEKGIRLLATVQSPLLLMGNVSMLTRAFTNLLQNALTYTSSGGCVSINAWLSGELIYVAIEDTGLGIAPEHLDKIFERFWRADQVRSYRTGGAGLGLSITQSLIHKHRGRITVRSQVEQGSCFTVQLPILSSS